MSSLENRRILITAGPTREWMDPVRFLSNPSTGTMGVAVARALKAHGAHVTLVLGPTNVPVPAGVRVVRVETAFEMFRAVQKNLRPAHAFIATAAVGDWRFKKTRSQKMKKSADGSLRVELVKNPDILAWAGEQKKKRPNKPLMVVGFALETQRHAVHAEQKRQQKNADVIVGNAPTSFGSSMIDAIWVERGCPIRRLGRLQKTSLAARVAAWLGKQWKTTASRP